MGNALIGGAHMALCLVRDGRLRSMSCAECEIPRHGVGNPRGCCDLGDLVRGGPVAKGGSERDGSYAP
jgi:hypothetical protein